MHIFTIVLGDPCDDGHGKSETFIISSNKTMEDVRLADKEMPIQMNEVCTDYEDDRIDCDMVEKMKAAGIDFNEDKFEGDMNEDGEYRPSPELLVEIWLDLLMLHDPTLELEIMAVNSLSTGSNVNVGYGLFY